MEPLKNYLILEQCTYETSLLYKEVPIMHCHSVEIHRIKGLSEINIAEIYKRNRKILTGLTGKICNSFEIRKESFKTGRASSINAFIARNKDTGEEFLVGEIRHNWQWQWENSENSKLYMSVYLTDWFHNYLKLKEEKAIIIQTDMEPAKDIEITEQVSTVI